MKDMKILLFLDRFQTLFQKAGVDYAVFRLILKMKLTMDARRIPTVMSNAKVNEQKEKNYFVRSLWIYALYGLSIVPVLFFIDQYFFQISIIFSILMFVLMTSMISDFSSVLLDIRDRSIIGPKPIHKRTLSAAKSFHVLIYMFLLTFATTTVPLVLSLFINGPLFSLLFLLEIVLLVMLILVLTAGIYVVILHFFDGERLKNMINYMQIALTIGILIGSQVVVRSFELVEITFEFSPAWWQVFVPPVWFGALHEAVLAGTRSNFLLVLAGLAIVVPVISIVIYIKLMPVFEHQLRKLSQTEGGAQKQKAKWKKQLARWISPNRVERSMFHFAGSIMKNERDFKLKVYPSIGFTLVIPFIFMFTTLQTSSFEEFREGSSFYLVYFTLLLIPNIFSMVKYSSSYKGSWVYQVTPLERKSILYSGTVKAALVKLFVPVYVVQSAIFLWLFSSSVLLDLVICLISAVLYSVICIKLLSNNQLPFTASFSLGQHQEGVKVFLLFLIILPLVGLHALSSLVPFGTEIYGLVMLAVAILTWKLAFRN
ncbi:hypothetical protein [Jeotgalibacillus campisalis]|uniref:Uncharacterized protein n=1 Tax=Jeotgalibacillus campisalis TaxID=220754 RepID=A0A0C2RRN2_9BACL|nr:hypothetical protein [Jeotgalibacillus campisalis]KIL52920.1 hypothetical protein KR50_02490 [Jeotgalibacillus campisalis]